MYTINFIFIGGTPWDKNEASGVYPGKTKSGLEHLLSEGGLSFDAGIDLLSYVRSKPIVISEGLDPKYPDACIVFHFSIEDEELKNEVLTELENARESVGYGFKMFIEVENHD